MKAFLENMGYEVKSEVHNCDLVAIREDEDEPIIVELKKTFNLSLLFQGLDRLNLSSKVYLAVELIKKQKKPTHQKWKDIQNLCQRIGLGLITVQFYKTKKPFVEILCTPANDDPSKFKKAISKKKSTRMLNEFKERSGDYNIGGSSKQKLVTAYRELSLQCAILLQKYGRLSPLQLRELTGKQKVTSILQDNYYGWFERVERGIYKVTPVGEDAIKTYEQIIQKIN